MIQIDSQERLVTFNCRGVSVPHILGMWNYIKCPAKWREILLRQTLQVCRTSDTQKIQPSDWPKWRCTFWRNVNSRIFCWHQTSFQAVCRYVNWVHGIAIVVKLECQKLILLILLFILRKSWSVSSVLYATWLLQLFFLAAYQHYILTTLCPINITSYQHYVRYQLTAGFLWCVSDISADLEVFFLGCTFLGPAVEVELALIRMLLYIVTK